MVYNKIGLLVIGAFVCLNGEAQAGNTNKWFSFGGAMKAGPLSVSKDGTRCYSASPVLPVSPVACENKKTWETSFGITTPAGSLQTGGRGNDGMNNFIKLGTPTLGGVVGPQGSVKIRTPSFTRSGITGSTTYDPMNKAR